MRPAELTVKSKCARVTCGVLCWYAVLCPYLLTCCIRTALSAPFPSGTGRKAWSAFLRSAERSFRLSSRSNALPSWSRWASSSGATHTWPTLSTTSTSSSSSWSRSPPIAFASAPSTPAPACTFICVTCRGGSSSNASTHLAGCARLHPDWSAAMCRRMASSGGWPGAFGPARAPCSAPIASRDEIPGSEAVGSSNLEVGAKARERHRSLCLHLLRLRYPRGPALRRFGCLPCPDLAVPPAHLW